MVKLEEMITRVTKFFKRYWIFIILAAVASGLLIVRLSQKDQPSPLAPQAIPSPQITLSSPKITGVTLPRNSTVSIRDFSFPSNLKIFQGQAGMISSDQAMEIAREFGFSGSPRSSEDIFLGNFHTWATEKHSLSIALDANKIDYGLDLFQSNPGKLPSPETTKTSLEDLLSRLNLEPSFEPRWQREEYLIEGYNLPFAPNPERADFIKIGFNPAIGQNQLVGLDPGEPLVSLVLDKGGEIIRFQYQVYFSGFEDQETYDLKTKEEVESILLSEGRIVYFGTFQESVRPPEITQAEFNQIALAYYQSPDKNPILQPIYILSGQGTLESGETTEIIAYLPAIKFGTQAPQNLEVPREFFQLPELP